MYQKHYAVQIGTSAGMAGDTGRETLIYFTSQVASSLAGFTATWFIANRLGAATLGKYSVVVALLFWLGVPMSAVDNAIKKRVSENVEPKAFMGAGHAVNVVLTAVVVGAVLLFRGQVNALVGAPVATSLALLVVARSLFDAVISSLRGQKRVGVSGWIKTTEKVLRSVFQIALIVLATATIGGLVLLYVAALLLSTVIGVYFFKFWFSRPTREHVRSLLDFAVFASLGTIRTRAFAWMDTMVLSFFAGATPMILAAFVAAPATVTYTEIGIYEVAWTLASVLALVSIAIKQALFPEISELGVEADFGQVRHLVNEGLAFTGIFGIPGAFGALVVGSELLTVYRPVFARGGQILVLLIVTRLFAAYGVQLLNVISALDRPDITFKINGVFIGSNLLLNVALIAWLGWYGAALATLLSSVVVLGLAAWQLRSLIDGLSVPTREIGYQVAASLVMYLVLRWLDTMVESTFTTAMALVCVGAAVYAVVLVALSDRVRQKGLSVAPV